MDKLVKPLLFYFAIPLAIIFGVSTCVTMFVSYSAEKAGSVKSSFQIHSSSLKLDPILAYDSEFVPKGEPSQEESTPAQPQKAVEVAPNEPILEELEQVAVDPKIKAKQPKAKEKPKRNHPLIAPVPKGKKLVKKPVEIPKAKEPIKVPVKEPKQPKPTNPPTKPTNPPKTTNPPKATTTKVSRSAGPYKMTSSNQTGQLTYFGIHPGDHERYMNVYLYPGKYKLTVKSFPESNHRVTFNFYDGAWHVSTVYQTTPPSFYYTISKTGWYKIRLQCEYMYHNDCRANAYLYRQ